MDDDGDDKDDTKRRTRNLSEKKRRDQFNMLVNELGSMVSTNNRKMDKSTVLKSTISFLKNHNEITVRSRAHDVQEDWKPAFLSNEEFTYLVLEALEGFVMVFSATGCIYYVSESVASLLGHTPGDIINKSIYDLAFEDDRQNLYSLLQNPGTSLDPTQGVATENEISFRCHLRRGTLDFRDEITYELVQFDGHFRTNLETNRKADLSYQQDHDSRVVQIELLAKATSRLRIPCVTESILLFVCTGRLYTPQLVRDVSLVDTIRSEFTSRHSLEWKFLFLDHRAPPIIGYLPFEVLGTSGYDYYHFDDLEKVVSCHEALMQKGELTSCYYRFLTKGQQWIWLQTRFYITYHQWNSKPEFVVCTHRVVSYADIVKSTKQESTEVEPVLEPEETRAVMKETSTEDAMVPVSPSYMSEASDAFGNSYHSLSKPASVKSAATSAGSTSATVATLGTTTTAGASWPTRSSYLLYTTGSDTASVSGGSRSSQRNSSHEVQRVSEPALVPQHGIGAQYLEPAPYVGAVGVPAVLPLPLPPIPVIVTPDQAQLQEQLQRTHRELQQMIVRQQEELRQVKEQLLFARLGILQPIINIFCKGLDSRGILNCDLYTCSSCGVPVDARAVTRRALKVQDPFSNPEQIQSRPASIMYEGNRQLGYPPPNNPQNHNMPPQ